MRLRVVEGCRLAPNASLDAVASRSLDRAQAYADEHGIARAHGSYEELLADPEIDAVYIPLPNSMHVAGITQPWIGAPYGIYDGFHRLCEQSSANYRGQDGRRHPCN